MAFQESIICTTGPDSSNLPSGAITFHDIHSGTVLASFKHSNALPHCTALLDSRDNHGGLILAAQPDKSILNVYTFQKDQIALKIVLPEKLSSIAIDKNGGYCAGGTAQGRIYLWEVASGIMFNAWDAHYRRVSVLRFTHDGAALISGSDDSGVSVWSLSSLLDNELQNELPEPYASLSDHTLPITDIVCGLGAFPNCRVLTSSADHSVKLWDLASRTQLATFLFPHPIACLAFEPAERLFFAASSDADGSIHQVHLFRHRETKSGRLTATATGGGVEALGGAGAEEAIRVNFPVGGERNESDKSRLIVAGHPVLAITISLTSSLLIAGTQSGLVQMFDIASHQLVRSISAHKGLRVHSVQCMLRPPDLVGHGHVQAGFGAGVRGGGKEEGMVTRPIVPFQRIKDVKTRENHEVLMLLPVRNDTVRDPLAYTPSELLRDHASFMPADPPSGGPPSSLPLTTPTGARSAANSAPALNARVSELEGEVARLREQLGKAKGVNDVMWETVVQRLVVDRAQPQAQPQEQEQGGAEPPAKKVRS
ncbi:WD40 repeat-like protein [Rickenella mellea]|uniref:Pre-rRNA-processing protein IPI3 n=1 Tax=Rickenella mellea TaxID=50990 RepID=A0A4Y7QAY4_9AGAM|nr:WD40 repeat-like protein [Rickenella mellea]